MIPYGRQDISDDDIAAVVAVLQSDFLTQGPQVPAFEAAVDTNGVPVYVLSTDSASMDLKRAANGSFTVSRPATNPGRTGHKVVELDARFRTVAEHETVGLEDTDSHDSILRPDGSRRRRYAVRPVRRDRLGD